ncbi:MAG: hypothetical protein CMJ94_15180 [Planctomycetes bacterium]|nr:hypothetical protein [Planctomycetota bacterium]
MAEESPRIVLPGCKSLSQRALLLAAVADGESVLRGVSDCEDSVHLQSCLAALGADFLPQPDGSLRVRGIGGAPQGERALDVGEAGSSLRFLLPLCAAGQGSFVITGTPRLISRPHGPLLDTLRELGAGIEEVEHAGRPGFRITASGLPAGTWPAPRGGSSQYWSGLAMAAAWSGGVELELPAELPSRGYFELTLEALRAFGGDAAWSEHPHASGSTLHLPSCAPQARVFQVPGDPSGATFFLVALVALQTEAELSPDWSGLHPEAGLLQCLLEAGLLERVGQRWMATGFLPSAPLELHLDPAPDAGPALAVLGAFLPQGLIMHGVERLRAKESDRVHGVQRLAELAGSAARLEGDRLHVQGGGIRPECAAAAPPFDPDQDHRMAMAAGVLQLLAPSLQISDPACVAKSFPGFWTEIDKLRPRAPQPD